MSRGNNEVNVSVSSGVQDYIAVTVRHEETEEKIAFFHGKNIAVPDVGDGLTVGNRTTSGGTLENSTSDTDRDDTLYRVVDRVYDLVNHDIDTQNYDKEIVNSTVEIYVLPSDEYAEQEFEEGE